MKIVLSASLQPVLGDRLPAAVEPLWFADHAEAGQLIVEADAAWLDLQNAAAVPPLVAKATRLKWLFTMAAGVERLDLAQLGAQGTVLTNGSGLNDAAVADYAVMGILAAAKRYDEVVRLADRHVWTTEAPGRQELGGTRALIVGLGTIGKAIARRLAAFDIAVTGVTRSGRDGTLGHNAWQARLGDYDWVILAAPATENTHAIIGAAELAAMKSSAWLVNIARGRLIDQPALIAALKAGSIGGAFLDTVSPEPLPADDPLWDAPNCLHSMHLSGRSQTSMMGKAVELFLENLSAWLDGRPMRNVVDVDAGY